MVPSVSSLTSQTHDLPLHPSSRFRQIAEKDLLGRAIIHRLREFGVAVKMGPVTI